MKSPKQANYNQAIMEKLLQEPGIREQVEQMTPEVLAWFKELLVQQGIYARYVKEQMKGKHE